MSAAFTVNMGFCCYSVQESLFSCIEIFIYRSTQPYPITTVTS